MDAIIRQYHVIKSTVTSITPYMLQCSRVRVYIVHTECIIAFELYNRLPLYIVPYRIVNEVVSLRDKWSTHYGEARDMYYSYV